MASGKKNNGDAADLAAIRKRINEVDEQIQALISERARHAQQVGVAKGDLGSAVDYYRPEREAAVLRAVLERNEGPLRDEEVLRLFREIMSACLAQQEPRRRNQAVPGLGGPVRRPRLDPFLAGPSSARTGGPVL